MEEERGRMFGTLVAMGETLGLETSGGFCIHRIGLWFRGRRAGEGSIAESPPIAGTSDI